MTQNIEAQQWSEFFSLNTFGQLDSFLNKLNVSSPQFAALKYYARSWVDIDFSDPEALFVPTSYVSEDLSAIKYGSYPVIFEGTNHWSCKPYTASNEIYRKIEIFKNHINRLRARFLKENICVLIILEKDHLISSEYKKEDRFIFIEDAVKYMANDLEKDDVTLIFKSPLDGLSSFMQGDDFLFRDSHLPSRAYINYFANAIEALYGNWSLVNNCVTMKKAISVGDLNDKFDDGMRGAEEIWLPNVPETSAQLTGGEAYFSQPLGSTWQRFKTENAPISKSVGIFGDSHSSIFDQRKLTYLFASTHKSSEFFWNPCGLRALPESLSYDSLIFEVSSRFIV
jgi:hypothetical protein